MKYRSKCCVLVMAALSLASCATPPQNPAPGRPASSSAPAVPPEMPTGLVQSAGGKKAVVHAGPSSAPKEDGQLHGTLASDGAGCIILQAPDGDTTTLVFPEGSTFVGETPVLPDGSSLPEGSAVILEGARVPANEELSMCLNHHRLFSIEKAGAQGR